jgi:hypothetical protein
MQFAAFIMLMILLACATTSTESDAVWKDATYQGHPEKILVINAVKNHTVRRLYEDELVKALKDRRIDAVVSYTVMPDPIVSDKKTIAALAYAVGADTVLISKPLGSTKGETSGAGISGADIDYLDVYISMQTDVYDMKSNRLVLSTTAETWIQQETPNVTLIKSYTKDLVQKLSKQGLF